MEKTKLNSKILIAFWAVIIVLVTLITIGLKMLLGYVTQDQYLIGLLCGINAAYFIDRINSNLDIEITIEIEDDVENDVEDVKE